MSVYKRKDTAFNKRLANFRAESGLRPVKPFPKTAQKMVVVTVEESGDLTFLKTDSADVFLELGAVVTRRASHVEPYFLLPRLAFTLLRMLSSDDSKIAAWTRTWACWWRVNTKPVGGPILRWSDVWGEDEWLRLLIMPQFYKVASWSNRKQAIEAEIQFLNRFFLDRGTK